MVKLKKCSVCGKDRFPENDLEQDWLTDFIIIVRNLKHKITICPDCRGKPLREILNITRFGSIDKYNK